MKNRIVYPEMWEDTDFNSKSRDTKLLFCYLINNVLLGLTRVSHVSDRRIMFDTGLDCKGLETGKKELTELKWVFFYKDWQYHNHKCAYMDYQGQPKVMIAKDNETKKIPQEVRDYFKGLLRGYQPVSNLPKSESESKPLSESKSKSESDFNKFKKFKDGLIKKVITPVLFFLLFFSFTKPALAKKITLTYTLKLTRPSSKLVDVHTQGQNPTSPTLKKTNQLARTDIENRILEVFEENGEIAIAIAKGESGLRTNSQGWNCYYNGVSMACKPEDRENAWSVDCGIFQLNVIGRICPQEYFDPDWNIQKAYEWKFLPHGFDPWVVYTTGSYKKFL